MRKGQIKNVTYLSDLRLALRKTLTPAEAALWNLLKNQQLDGRKFRRQVSIENYIVDFYCAEEKLVIEFGWLGTQPPRSCRKRYAPRYAITRPGLHSSPV